MDAASPHFGKLFSWNFYLFCIIFREKGLRRKTMLKKKRNETIATFFRVICTSAMSTSRHFYGCGISTFRQAFWLKFLSILHNISRGRFQKENCAQNKRNDAITTVFAFMCTFSLSMNRHILRIRHLHISAGFLREISIYSA